MNDKQIAKLDITGEIGPIYPIEAPRVSMYSFNTPAWYFWNAFAQGLAKRGLSRRQILNELQSSGVRHLLDRECEKLEAAGFDLAMDYEFCVSKPRRGKPFTFPSPTK